MSLASLQSIWPQRLKKSTCLKSSTSPKLQTIHSLWRPSATWSARWWLCWGSGSTLWLSSPGLTGIRSSGMPMQIATTCMPWQSAKTRLSVNSPKSHTTDSEASWRTWTQSPSISVLTSSSQGSWSQHSSILSLAIKRPWWSSLTTTRWPSSSLWTLQFLRLRRTRAYLEMELTNSLLPLCLQSKGRHYRPAAVHSWRSRPNVHRSLSTMRRCSRRSWKNVSRWSCSRLDQLSCTSRSSWHWTWSWTRPTTQTSAPILKK